MSEVKVNKISPRTNCGTTQLGDAGDTITVTGDLKSNSLKSASGSTITLGQSGDTIQLGCGASQTGFGRTGTVDWDTTAKTASFTAVNGNGYFVDTTSGAVTMTLPAGSAGAIVAISDYSRTFGTNNLTISPNGSEKIGGIAENLILSVNGQALTFVYVDATQGWINVQNAEDTETGIPNFISATGGTETTCGDYKVHTFTGPGTFSISNIAPGPSGNPNAMDYLVVAGGAGGATCNGGGGGAGGFRLSNATCMPAPLTSPLATPTSLTATVTSIPVTVGAGGPADEAGSQGSSSIFSTITSAGGGKGYGTGDPVGGAGSPGGSGGGGKAGAGPSTSNPYPGGTGNVPPVSPPQGNNGGAGWDGRVANNQGGGGGGAGAAGSNATVGTGGNGGIGSYVLNGAGFAGCHGTTGPVSLARYFAGGGGGGTNEYPGCHPQQGTGGAGGGGNAGSPTPERDGGTNTGGGSGAGGSGGSGIVIIRYKYQ
jgi:hypothetical protein